MRKKKEWGTSSAETLCSGCPKEYQDIYDYLSTLNYPDKPDYASINCCLEAVVKRKTYLRGRPLDWEPEGDNVDAGAKVPNATMLHDGPFHGSQGS